MADAQPTSYPHHDAILELWVSLANTDKTEVTVTLQVGGFLVSGILTSYSNYFTAVGEQFEKDMPGSQGAWRDAFAELVRSSDTSEVPPPNHIHLRDARMYTAGGVTIPTYGSFLWRGRLAAVDAWWFGQFNRSE